MRPRFSLVWFALAKCFPPYLFFHRSVSNPFLPTFNFPILPFFFLVYGLSSVFHFFPLLNLAFVLLDAFFFFLSGSRTSGLHRFCNFKPLLSCPIFQPLNPDILCPDPFFLLMPPSIFSVILEDGSFTRL